ncbi:hypothetical protein D918_05428 [Trichuris suis]|nr:hypothetical protein D918_05428 [Trichuris suis]
MLRFTLSYHTVLCHLFDNIPLLYCHLLGQGGVSGEPEWLFSEK